MSSTRDILSGPLIDEIHTAEDEPPLHDEFEELERFSDDVEDPELTVYYHETNLDAWLRFESWLAVDLEEVQ